MWTTSSAATVYLTFPDSPTAANATQTVTAVVMGGRTSTGCLYLRIPDIDSRIIRVGQLTDGIPATKDNDDDSSDCRD